MPKVTPCLWFDGQAEEAANHYTSIIKNSKFCNMVRYGEAAAEVSGQPAGSVMTVRFELDGQEFLALNGGPHFNFSPAISFIINCDSQDEGDELWERLTQDGKEGQCGWLTDKFGVSWQIVPTAVSRMIQDPDPAKSERVTRALLNMKKIELDALQKAYGK